MTRDYANRSTPRWLGLCTADVANQVPSMCSAPAPKLPILSTEGLDVCQIASAARPRKDAVSNRMSVLTLPDKIMPISRKSARARTGTPLRSPSSWLPRQQPGRRPPTAHLDERRDLGHTSRHD